MNAARILHKLLAPAVLSAALLVAPAAAAGAPPLLPVQGVLTNAEGFGLEGAHDVSFRLFDAETDGSVLGAETQTITFERGVFVAYVGGGGADGGLSLDLSLFRDRSDLWLEVSIDGGAPLPRYRLGSVPYAAYAEYCGTAVTLSGKQPADLAVGTHDHAWSELVDLPSGLADGDNDAIGTISCTDGQIPVLGALGWSCSSNAVAPTMVAFFDRPSCPPGWSELIAARGRTMVGLQPGGTLQGAVGGALSNLENRTHTHPINPPSSPTTTAPGHTHTADSAATLQPSADGSHTHSIGGPTASRGYNTYAGIAHGEDNASTGSHTHYGSVGGGAHRHEVDLSPTTSAADSGHLHNLDLAAQTSGPSSASNVVPYIQYIACKKD